MAPVQKSYLKSTLACLIAASGALLIGAWAATWLPRGVGLATAAAFAIAAIVAGLLGISGVVVLTRYRRLMRGETDLFLHLNRTREPDSLAEATRPRFASARRWFMRRMVGHDFLVGDEVEVKSWAEILATLDGRGRLEELPFMPEMLAMCGRRARVFRCMHRLFDYRKTRRMRHMGRGILLTGVTCDGSSHGGCEAMCHTIWKPEWLRSVVRSTVGVDTRPHPASPEPADCAPLGASAEGGRFICQLTQLQASSEPIDRWTLSNFLLPVISGNVAWLAFVVGYLTHAFNELQQLRGGFGFPDFGPRHDVQAECGEPRLSPGEVVLVRSPAEIRSTLNEQLMHRGMWFEPDMMKHCGRRCTVQAEIRKIVDIVTGEMRTMKTPAYLLRGVHFSGERQLFNAQYEPLFWRSAWLERTSASQDRADLATP